MKTNKLGGQFVPQRGYKLLIKKPIFYATPKIQYGIQVLSTGFGNRELQAGEIITVESATRNGHWLTIEFIDKNEIRSIYVHENAIGIPL